MTPRVSVLMTIYNAERFLREAIDSVLAQTFADFELVAVDDGSRAPCKDMIRDYARVEPRIQLIDLPGNIGRTPALNVGLRAARGEYVAVLDADDIARPHRLARQVDMLDRNPNVVLVGSYVRQIDESGNVLCILTPAVDAGVLRESMAYSNPFAHSASMYRRAPALSTGGYPEAYAYAQDFALWLELARRGELAMIDEPLTDVRQHAMGDRMSVSATYQTARFRDTLELFQQAQGSLPLSPRSWRLARANLSSAHMSYAQALLASGRPLGAAVEACNSVAAAPVHVMRKACQRLLRLGRAP